MSRKSQAALATVTPIRPARYSPTPPDYLPVTAQRVWREVIASRAPDYFDLAAAPILATYCTATVEHRRLSQLLGELDPLTDFDRLTKLARMIDMHAARIGAAATKLRLSNQSRYTPQRAANAGVASPADRIRAAYRSDEHES